MEGLWEDFGRIVEGLWITTIGRHDLVCPPTSIVCTEGLDLPVYGAVSGAYLGLYLGIVEGLWKDCGRLVEGLWKDCGIQQ